MANNDVIAALSLQVGASTVKLRGEMDSAAASTRAASRVMRESFAEGRAGIKQLGEEIGINLNRHLVSFLAKLPGVAPLMAAAFPAAAVIGIGIALVEAGKRLTEFVEKNKNAAQKINEGFDAMHQSSKLASDEMAVANDKIADQIALLDGKHKNTLQDMLDDARVAADKLYKSLQNDNKEIADLIEKNQVKALGGLVTFQAPTANTEEVIKKQKQDLDEISQKYQALTDSAKTAAETQKAKAEERNALLAAEQKQLKDLNDLHDYIKHESTTPGASLYGGVSQDAVLALLRGRGQQLQDMMRGQQLGFKNADSSDEEKRKADAKAAADEAKRQRDAETRSLIEDSIKDMARTEQEGNRIDDTVSSVWEDAMKRDEAAQKRMEQAALRAFEMANEQQKAAEKIQEERIKLEVAMGRMSRLAGAKALQQVHDDTFKQWEANSSRFSASNPDIPLPGGAQPQQLHDLQSVQDAAAIRTATALGRLEESTRSLMTEFTDLGAIASRTLVQSLNSLNETIVKILSSRAGSMQGEHPWRQLGGGIFREATNSGLQYAEGSLMKAFGIGGKKGDSAGNPLWVSIVGGAAAAGQGLSGVFSKIGSIFHLPGFAEGGMVTAGVPILVGERGPEPFVPSTAGRVIPHNQMGGGNQTIHIDARGASDPAAVQAAVARSMTEYLPHLKSHAVAAMRDDRARRPARGR